MSEQTQEEQADTAESDAIRTLLDGYPDAAMMVGADAGVIATNAKGASLQTLLEHGKVEAIQAMIDNYFRPGTVIQAGYPIEMRYAGPREALFHALIRQNYGCSHLIVGRDHAGVGDYYGPFDAHHIFDEIDADALLTQPLKIDITFYCTKCYGMATAKTCPHGKEDQIHISGTDQRRMLGEGADIPPEFSRPEVVKILQDYYSGLDE